MISTPYQTGFIYGLILILGFTSSCASDETDPETNLTLHSSRFPEIQEMISNVRASLEIAGKSCALTVDSDTTLSGRCRDIPPGSYPYSLKYFHSDGDVIIGMAEGTANIELGKRTDLTLPPLEKDQDDDQDAYPNLFEVMFGADPLDGFSIPSISPWAPLASFNVGSEPSHLTVGDLNGDDILDVVTANRGSDSVSVLLGNSDGTLLSMVDYAMPPPGPGSRQPEGVALGDLNGDLNLDVIVVSSGADSSYPGDVGVFLGNGDGTLSNPAFYAVGDHPIALDLGDLNKDGFLDVVTGNYESEDVAVLLGRGDGTFQSPVFYSSGTVNAISLGDMNGDNQIDLLASDFFSQSVDLFLGNGDGTFQSPISYLIGFMSDLTIGDLDGDGRLDLVVSFSSSNTLAVLLGNGDGSFQTTAIYPVGDNPESLVLGDLDGDGGLDIVASNSDNGVVAMLLGSGGGTFGSPAFFEMGLSLSAVTLGDLNGDGALDLFSTDDLSDTVKILVTQ